MSNINRKTETLDETTTIVSWVQPCPVKPRFYTGEVGYITTTKCLWISSISLESIELCEQYIERMIKIIKEEREDHVSNTLCYD